MKNLKTSIKTVLVALFLIHAFGRPSPADLIDPEPPYLLEAQLLALELSGLLRPPEGLTQQIFNDLAAIRSAFPDVADITYRCTFVPNEILVGITEQAVIQFQQGQYHALDELNAFYGVVDIDLHVFHSLGIGFLKLKFDQIYNTELLSDIYEQANPDGLRHAQPNYVYGDGSTISADPPFYIFIRAWGDCPSGCTYHEFWPFKVEGGQAVLSNEYYVDAENGNDRNLGFSPKTAFATIQSAIDAAVDGDVVIVTPSTYTGPGNRDIDFLGKAITVRSIDPNDPNIVAATIIDCNKEHSHRGFFFHNDETPSSILAGLTITNGNLLAGLGYGAGIYCERSSPTINNCIVTGNSAASGGGIACLGGIPRITNCIITNNRSRSPGGSNGGGVWSIDNSRAILTSCIISGNSADYGGGISCWEKNQTEIRNCTIVGNFASYSGGGIDSYTRHSQPIVSHSILWDNSSDINGPEVSLRSYYQPSILTFSYSNVKGGLAAMDIEPGSYVIWRPGNINVDPCFVEPGYWADANDPNVPVEPNDPNAIWVDGDYHLLPTSPCIDAGDPNYIPEPNETDLDGNPRINDGRIDMGAYESPVPVDIVIDTHTLNLSSKGKWLSCHIWLPEDYNVADIDPNSIFLEDDIQSERIWLNEQQQVITAKFSRPELQDMLNIGDIELTVTGELMDGTRFEGTDTIRVIDKGRKSAR